MEKAELFSEPPSPNFASAGQVACFWKFVNQTPQESLSTKSTGSLRQAAVTVTTVTLSKLPSSWSGSSLTNAQTAHHRMTLIESHDTRDVVIWSAAAWRRRSDLLA